MSEIFLDTETTGLSFKDGHKLVEIACIETKDLIPNGNVFHKLVNPERDVPEEAQKIHGFSTELLKTKESFNLIADNFINFIKDKKLIIHNAPFDLSFLNYELRLVRKNEIKKNQVIDTLELARGKFIGSSNSLDALCKRFNIDLSRRKKHNALLDCELLREVYINLIEAKEPKFSFLSELNEVEKNIGKKNSAQYCKNIIKPSAVEIEKHNDFLKKEIKKNYY